jgi:glycosyltransferase involved in cell wall biosynthesis
MQFTVVVNGKFHAFDYVAELQRRGMLRVCISTMPMSVAKQYGIRRENYIGLPYLELLKRIWRITLKSELPTMMYAKLFTRVAASKILDKTDVLVSFAGYSHELFNHPRLKESIKILDRGSTHTLANQLLKKQACEFHGTQFVGHSQKFLERELKEYDLADLIMVPSGFVRQTFIDHGIPSQKLLLNRYGVSENRFAGLSTESRSRKRAVLFVGQGSERKGIGVLVKAVEAVRQEGFPAELWIVGAMSSEFKSRYLSMDWIKYFGVLKGQELLNKYYEAGVFCLPSFEEGLALVLLEAASARVKIVATRNTGVDDLHLPIGFVYTCEAGSVNGLKQSLCSALNSAETAGEVVSPSMLPTWHQFSENLIASASNLKVID